MIIGQRTRASRRLPCCFSLPAITDPARQVGESEWQACQAARGSPVPFPARRLGTASARAPIGQESRAAQSHGGSERGSRCAQPGSPRNRISTSADRPGKPGSTCMAGPERGSRCPQPGSPRNRISTSADRPGKPGSTSAWRVPNEALGARNRGRLGTVSARALIGQESRAAQPHGRSERGSRCAQPGCWSPRNRVSTRADRPVKPGSPAAWRVPNEALVPATGTGSMQQAAGEPAAGISHRRRRGDGRGSTRHEGSDVAFRCRCALIVAREPGRSDRPARHRDAGRRSQDGMPRRRAARPNIRARAAITAARRCDQLGRSPAGHRKRDLWSRLHCRSGGSGRRRAVARQRLPPGGLLSGADGEGSTGRDPRAHAPGSRSPPGACGSKCR